MQCDFQFQIKAMTLDKVDADADVVVRRAPAARQSRMFKGQQRESTRRVAACILYLGSAIFVAAYILYSVSATFIFSTSALNFFCEVPVVGGVT